MAKLRTPSLPAWDQSREGRCFAVSNTTLLILLTIGWLLYQYIVPLSLSYFYLSRDEDRERAEGREPRFAHHHMPTPA